jgi:hypothetical protein
MDCSEARRGRCCFNFNRVCAVGASRLLAPLRRHAKA